MFTGDITIRDLVTLGLVTVGDEWRHVTIQGQKRGIVRATVTDSGGLRLRSGKGFDNPSRAARAVSGSSTNGWRYWQYQREGDWAYINELRDRARKMKAAAS